MDTAMITLPCHVLGRDSHPTARVIAASVARTVWAEHVATDADCMDTRR